MRRRVTITSSVVANPDSTFPVQIKPYKLDISQFGDKVRDEMKFTITNVSEQDLDLTLIASPTEYLAEVDLPKTLKVGQAVEGRIKVREDALSKSFEKSFTFELNDEMKSRFTVPVKRMMRAGGHAEKPDAGNEVKQNGVSKDDIQVVNKRRRP